MRKKVRKPSVKAQLKSALNVIQEQSKAMASMETALHKKAHEIGELRGQCLQMQQKLRVANHLVVKLDDRVGQLVGTIARIGDAA